MKELLLKLIEDRGTEISGKKALQAQLVLEGGVQVAGAITDEGDHFRALSLVASDPREAPQMIEFYFLPETVRTIIAPADEGMRDAYEAMVTGRAQSSRIVQPS